jgi:NAD(P)-dependent dehydrogenase (short-subunit alcohol dehydrogenase family)
MPGWVTVPLGEMYNPVFFIGTTFAIHGDTDFPLRPASHGCVRIPMDIAAFFHTLLASFLSGIPALGRYGSAEDIAALVTHLAGDGGRYVTGTAISVDGGFAA